MSDNDGHDWYDVKNGNGLDQGCCDYQEIFFPAVHAKMFKLNMINNHGAPQTSLSYIEFHFLPEPDTLCPYYAVPYQGFCYAVMDRTLYRDNMMTCQENLMKLPIGWHLVDHSPDIVKDVVKAPYDSDTYYH
jgi:hypothetical protein